MSAAFETFRTQLLAAAREIVGDDWADDQILNVVRKVRSESPDELMDHIASVLAWCAAALTSGDDEAVAAVEIWQMDGMPAVITVGPDGGIFHALEADSP